jgi:hypothetical protein
VVPEQYTRRADDPVVYAFVQDIASTWAHYEHVRASLTEPLPLGLILHVAGPTDEGFRVIEVWDSEEAWQRFCAERLQPALAALGGPARPAPTFRDLHPAHVVLGRDPLEKGRKEEEMHSDSTKRRRNVATARGGKRK